MDKLTIIKDALVALTRGVRQAEESMPLSFDFAKQTMKEGEPYHHRYKSATLQISYNNLREARMFLGDALRCIGVEKPYEHAYTGVLQNQTPKYMDGQKIVPICWGDIVKAGAAPEKSPESICLGHLKTLLGDSRSRKGYLYELLMLRQKMLYPAYPNQLKGIESDKRSEYWHELKLYLDMAFESIKKANCYLGLRFGEMVTPVETKVIEEPTKEEEVKEEVIVASTEATEEICPEECEDDSPGEGPVVD